MALTYRRDRHTYNFALPDNGLYTVAVSVTDGVTTYSDSARCSRSTCCLK